MRLFAEQLSSFKFQIRVELRAQTNQARLICRNNFALLEDKEIKPPGYESVHFSLDRRHLLGFKRDSNVLLKRAWRGYTSEKFRTPRRRSTIGLHTDRLEVQFQSYRCSKC